MSPALLYSAPEENYTDHIERCMSKFNLIFPSFYSTILRILNLDRESEAMKGYFSKMIELHDIGKLTKRWQERIKPYKPPLPAHATIGAAYLWKILPNGIKEPISFAVAIHHTDKGLLGDNIEKPDVQAILDGIIDHIGNINWHDEAKKLGDPHFPIDTQEIKLTSLKDMARGLRAWAKGCGLLEQHERRLQASFVHHILKLCDISAATERKEYIKRDDQDYYGGWLMVENIKNYVDAIRERVNK
jgi:CRISPR-associated endonuclease Cas3-HD